MGVHCPFKDQDTPSIQPQVSITEFLSRFRSSGFNSNRRESSTYWRYAHIRVFARALVRTYGGLLNGLLRACCLLHIDLGWSGSRKCRLKTALNASASRAVPCVWIWLPKISVYSCSPALLIGLPRILRRIRDQTGPKVGNIRTGMIPSLF